MYFVAFMTAPWRLAFVGLHSKPDDAVEEIGYLDVVGAEVERVFSTSVRGDLIQSSSANVQLVQAT